MDALSKCIKLAIKHNYHDFDFISCNETSVRLRSSETGGGYINFDYKWAEILLDPAFFQALGRGLGWQEKGYPDKYEGHWKAQWSYEHHRLIDWIDDGKSVEEFMRLLLTK